jgi:tryptophanyl-tRNA synthetase
VGDDQLQHLELTREVARKFNHMFGETFPEPEARLTKGARIMSLTQPDNKMSKSDAEKSYITLDEEPDRITSKVKKAVTDTGTSGETGPGVKNLLTILGVIAPDSVSDFEAQAKAGTIRYSHLKLHLAEKLSEYLAPFRARRAELASKPEGVWELLAAGHEKAQRMTAATLQEVKDKMGFISTRGT